MMDTSQIAVDADFAAAAHGTQHNADATVSTRTHTNNDIDWAIVERVNNGQRGAFDLLVAKYQHRVIRLLSRYVDDTADAMDLAQDTFIKAYRALPRFRGDSKFSTWLHRIAINTAKNHVVSRRRMAWQQPLIEDDKDLSHDASPEHELLAEEIRQTVSLAIDELSSDLKTTIILRALEGFSYAQIAHELSCPVGTVRSKIFRAREQISARLDGLLHT